MFQRLYHPGDQVIYHKTKSSAHPGPRAQHIHPAPQGESYSYEVDKFWVVVAQQEDGTVQVMTRTGKTHRLAADDPNLRRAVWWERWWYRHRFPVLLHPGHSSPPTLSRPPN